MCSCGADTSGGAGIATERLQTKLPKTAQPQCKGTAFYRDGDYFGAIILLEMEKMADL